MSHLTEQDREALWDSIERAFLDTTTWSRAAEEFIDEVVEAIVARHRAEAASEALEAAVQRVEAVHDATEWNDWPGQMRLERRILRAVREGGESRG